MNSNLSPAWLDTNDDDHKENASPADAPNIAMHKTAVRIPVGSHRVSRKPAAIVGILLTMGVGFSLLEGADGLKGQMPGTPAKQLESAAVAIHITEDGISPRIVEVAPGQKIVWTNDQRIPHILESETLLGENGSLLYTPAIFPGSSEEFWVSPLQEPGRHSYLSTTSVDVFGEINVLDPKSESMSAKTSAPAKAPPIPTSDPAMDPDAFGSNGEEWTDNVPEDASLATDENPNTIDSSDPLAPGTKPLRSFPNHGDEPLDQDALIPYNPYTVGSTHKDAWENLDGSLRGGAPLKQYRPMQNTKTGPALWIVSVLSIGLLAWITRKSFRAFR